MTAARRASGGIGVARLAGAGGAEVVGTETDRTGLSEHSLS